MYDDAEGQRRSDDHTFFKIDCISESGRTNTVSLILHYYHIDCIGECGSTSSGCFEDLLLVSILRHLGIKIGFKMGVS